MVLPATLQTGFGGWITAVLTPKLRDAVLTLPTLSNARTTTLWLPSAKALAGVAPDTQAEIVGCVSKRQVVTAVLTPEASVVVNATAGSEVATVEPAAGEVIVIVGPEVSGLPPQPLGAPNSCFSEIEVLGRANGVST